MSLPDTDAHALLDKAVAALSERTPNPFFLQVGGFDGVSFDPLRRHVVERKLSGLIVEPIPQYFEKLQSLYWGSERVSTVNCAIGEENGERTIWRFNPEAITSGLLPPHFAGISSFLMEDLLSESGVLGRSSPNAATTAQLRKLLQPVAVKCRTIDSLLSEFGIGAVDILQVDTEGYDFIVLKLFDLERFQPGIVHYEHQHLNADDRESAERLLRTHGYRVYPGLFDTLAIIDDSASRIHGKVHALRNLASSFYAEGRHRDALMLLEHLRMLEPANVETLTSLAKMQRAAGHTLEAMRTLSMLVAVSDDRTVLMDEIGEQKRLGFERFNAHTKAGELQQAANYAAALATLFPYHEQVIDAAFSSHAALGRIQKAVKYAITLIDIQPKHIRALDFFRALRQSAEGANVENDSRVAAVFATPNKFEPLHKLRNFADAVDAILCANIDQRRVDQVERILSAAENLHVGVEVGSKWAFWEKAYRLLLQSVDMAAVLGPTPVALPDPDLDLLTSALVPVDWSHIQQVVTRIGAKVVFYVAADEAYVTRYARYYALSILKNCDVSCIIVIHVIGGAGDLPRIAKSVGVDDQRLVFSGDDFVADEIETQCYDTPPRGLIPRPVAHFQSARFIGLGSLLKTLGLPTIVSDIDLILQRGVGDLLQRCSGADVVFNLNDYSLSIASRLTANLLLVYLTINADHFTRFLRSYLEKELSKSAVSRWIDQIALVFARHHLYRLDSPQIRYFDTNSDINNIIYSSYQENQFRFLSLYNGFDTSSLENVVG